MAKRIPKISDIHYLTLRDRIGVSGVHAWNLIHGKRIPSLTIAVRIEEEFGIPPSAWLKQYFGVQDSEKLNSSAQT